ncbi:PHD-finger domain-containing protein [Colletotrichum truncatum]|uniref:PHD-finger domain-containing protein n=1 Tax=Colletotrichum truncatum TaxID=5467 RepID=A0ACC3YZU4_COLTU|nr:PHD-finger domain-containing protein [Colletotrichum truncatum]KAF6800886.1 PHD-finger domain-containing protein [Colletotrichum truncatum]
MDSDVDQVVNDHQQEDREMGDAPAQPASLPHGAPQPASLPYTDLKFATLSPDSDLTSSTNQIPTNSASSLSNLNNTILETTERPSESQKMTSKKKGTATIKKTPKRPKGAGPKSTKSKKQLDTASATSNTPAPDDLAGGSDDESDNGPYCICRGPDDHRFMISCDVCEDWFHGECINMAKDVGENLIERFVCPNCTDGDQNVSLFKKMCQYNNCKKAARLYDDGPKSAFCSDEHKQMWWEVAISRLPVKKTSKNATAQDGLTREELMGLLGSNLAGIDPTDGKFKINTRPFAAPAAEPMSPEAKSKPLSGVLTEEEEDIIKASAADRYRMGEETVLCQKMLQLTDMASDRRKALIASKKLDDASCGYDNRLDQVGVVGPFGYWLNHSDEAKEIFKAGNLDVGSHLSGDDKNICDKKRCKTHQGWYSMHTRDVRHLMKILAMEANKNLDNERLIREAAAERKLRKEAEHNSVRHVGPDGTFLPSEVM